MDLAIQDYTKVIQLEPNFTNAYYNRGVAYSNKGELDLAIQDYTKAIELVPDYAEGLQQPVALYTVTRIILT